MSRHHWLLGLAALAAGLGGGAWAWQQRTAEPPARLCADYPGLPETVKAWHQGMVAIPSGDFAYGGEGVYPEEGPVQQRHVDGFWIDAHPVTNAQFARFVQATGYQTRAERGWGPENGPGGMVFDQGAAPGWHFIAGADWRHPEGPASDIVQRMNHPVVQVTSEDANAYAHWAGGVLPSELQLEYALRGGLSGATFAWGNQERPHGHAMANTWQGEFPYDNRAADGFTGTSPVGCFPANGYGLFDAGGNVWQLTASRYYPRHGIDPVTKQQWPQGYDPAQPGVAVQVIKGGSHLCADGACWRYRPAARQPQAQDLPTGHVGFRLIRPRNAA